MTQKTHDIGFLLAGENKEKRPRSNHTIDIFRKGRIGYIFVSGGPGAEAKSVPIISEAQKIANYLNLGGIPSNRIYFDGRSFETLGNITFPCADPIKGNPKIDDLESILMITEEKHMERVPSYAELVIPKEKLSYESTNGFYKPNPFLEPYHIAMLHRLRGIKEPNPKRIIEFLQKENPIYQKEWFNSDMKTRYAKLALAIAKWSFGRSFS
ncbi:MAG: YdcF family protein [Candidatus Woesearchaeota archaeon]